MVFKNDFILKSFILN